MSRRYAADIEALLEGGPLHQRKGEDFRPYQKWMSRLCCDIPYVLLAAEMGLGKTAAVLRALVALIKAGKVKRVLVIAPINVARDTWPEEIMTWDFCRDLTFSVIVGTDAERREAASHDVHISIVNRENVVWLWRFFGATKWPYDTIVYDEASRLKGAEEVTKPTVRKDGSVSRPKLSEFGALTRIRKFTDRVIEMSGTPSPNGLKDLYGPIYFLDRGARLGVRKKDFMTRWFNVNPYSHEIKAHDHSFGEITERCKDIMFSLREEDYLTLPKLVKSERWVTLDDATVRKYNRLQSEFVLAEHDVEAVNSGVLANKLLQLANGSIYNSEKEAVFLHNRKLDELASIQQEASGEPLLIAYSFKFDLDQITKRFPKFRVYGSSKTDMRDWNLGRIPGLIIHPQAAGHGLNFQYGGSIMVWYGLSWSLEGYLQTMKRLHRSGQKADRVIAHHILARRTYDERVMQVLRDKKVTQDAITGTCRVTAERVLSDMKLAA